MQIKISVPGKTKKKNEIGAKMKKDKGIIFLPAIFLLVAVSGIFSMLFFYEKAKLEYAKKQHSHFYRELEFSNNKLSQEAKNEAR